MINEAKFELLNQIDYWTKELEKYGKKHQREVELFQLEKMALINSNIPNMESVIRKYEQLKLVYQEITSNHSQSFRDDTFNTLYNKYCTEKKNASTTKKSKKSSSLKVQPSINQPSLVPTQIIDEYIDEIDFYSDKITHLQGRIEYHKHDDLERQLEQLVLESKDLQTEFRNIEEENSKLKEEIINNQQRVTELRELQLQLIEEFKQFN